MSTNQVAIIVHENEQVIKALALKMHLWVAATDKNKSVVEAIWELNTQKEFIVSHYDIEEGSTAEEMCLIAIVLVDDHHSSAFGAESWLEIQVHGCHPTEKLVSEFRVFGNVTITKQGYGFNVTRPSE